MWIIGMRSVGLNVEMSFWADSSGVKDSMKARKLAAFSYSNACADFGGVVILSTYSRGWLTRNGTTGRLTELAR